MNRHKLHLAIRRSDQSGRSRRSCLITQRWGCYRATRALCNHTSCSKSNSASYQALHRFSNLVGEIRVLNQWNCSKTSTGSLSISILLEPWARGIQWTILSLTGCARMCRQPPIPVEEQRDIGSWNPRWLHVMSCDFAFNNWWWSSWGERFSLGTAQTQQPDTVRQKWCFPTRKGIQMVFDLNHWPISCHGWWVPYRRAPLPNRIPATKS